MKILCFVDSIHYTDPEYIRVADDTTDKEVARFVEKKLTSDVAYECGQGHNPVITWMDEGKRAEISVLLSDNERYFIVCEIKEVDDGNYISAYHHCYEGVGFEVKSFDTIEEARNASSTWADEIKRDRREVISDERSINFINIDDSYQWHMFTSQLVFETEIAKAAA